MATLRWATAADDAFLQEMLAAAVNWRSGAPTKTVDQVMEMPDIAHYVVDWPADDDVGLVLEDGLPLGAAWWTFFGRDDPGYGFVDEEIPEVSIGVTRTERGKGLGTVLLGALIVAARNRDLPGISLSVDPQNPALRLYERLGFKMAGGVGGSLTLCLHLGV